MAPLKPETKHFYESERAFREEAKRELVALIKALKAQHVDKASIEYEKRLFLEAKHEERLARREAYASLRERLAEAERKSRQIEAVRARLLMKYNLTLERYHALLQDQANKCLICQREFDDAKIKPCVDHCHETNRIPRTLCSPCNGMIGMARESEDVLFAGIRYLREHARYPSERVS